MEPLFAGRGGAGEKAPAPRIRRTRRRPSDRGIVSIEFIGFLPILLAVALGAVQLGLAAYAAQQAGTGARAAARTASSDEAVASPEGAGRAAISGWLADEASFSVSESGDEARATARVKIPSVIPGLDFGTAQRTAVMPRTPDTPADDAAVPGTPADDAAVPDTPADGTAGGYAIGPGHGRSRP
ncbi:TadE family protein [Streptomyces sp. P1-3]|uniref:TadE family protein n=1 Tax=Streptomyces sp. P1-3 TaxID=3421658 RepID=UPI003D35D105